MKRDDQIIGNDHLSIRLRNCCRAYSIYTIGALLDMPREELLKMRNFGRITLDEVELIRTQVKEKSPSRFLTPWKDVEREMPAVGVWVLVSARVHRDMVEPFIASINHKGNWHCKDTDRVLKRVDAWMELPCVKE